jgi:hypothetical protein
MAMKILTIVPSLMISGFFALLLTSTSIVAQESEGELSFEQEIAALKAEMALVRGMLPAQAVAMIVAEYNFSNLWFAAHEENWALAEFFLSETRSRLRWSLRISPQRRISSGQVELQPFLDVLEQNHLATIGESMQAQDIPAFETAYNNALNACYSCHVASEKAFLRLEIPSAPAGSLISFGSD